MGSFSDLNTYSQTQITYTDLRDPGVEFNVPFAFDLIFTITSKSFTAQRTIDIVDVIRPEVADVTYSIDVSAVSGATVTWSTIPAGCTVTNVGGVYTIDGIDDADTWETVRAPLITVPDSFEGSFFYTSAINYTTPAGRQTEDWNVGIYVPVSLLTVTATQTLTARRVRYLDATEYASGFQISATLSPAGLSATEETDWLAEQSNNISGSPLIVYDDLGDTWTVEVTADDTSSITLISYNGSYPGTGLTQSGGGTILTITGTKTQVNAVLPNLRFVANTVRADFNFVYTASRSGDPGTSWVRTQSARCMNLQRLTDARGIASYTTAVESLIGTSANTIYDPDYTGSGTYTLTVKPKIGANIADMTTTGLTKWGVQESVEDPDDNTGESIGNTWGRRIGYGSTDNYMALSISSDDPALPATNNGAVYWYNRTNYEWSRVFYNYGNTSTPAENYGWQLVMADDNTTIVGDNSSIGQVRVFQKNATGNTWYRSQTIAAPDAATYDSGFFGYSVAASRTGDLLVIGQPTVAGDAVAGRIHIYTRSGTQGYSKIQTITDPLSVTGNAGSTFSFRWGSLVDVSPDGSRILVVDTDRTRCYIYGLNAGVWTQETQLTGVFQVRPRFNTAGTAIFAPTADFDANQEAGSVVYYKKSGGTWSLNQTITSPQAVNQEFGNLLALAGDQSKVAIGERYDYGGWDIHLYDYDAANDTLTLDRTVNTSTFMNQIHGIALNLTGTEILIAGLLENNEYGFVSYSYAPKPLSWNSNTKTLTIEGTKTEVQSEVDTIKIVTAAGVTSDIVFDVSVTTPESNTQTKSFTARNA